MRVQVRFRLYRLMIVEEYIKDLDDADTLMDMMSANASFEQTSIKRGENIYPEVLSTPSISQN